MCNFIPSVSQFDIYPMSCNVMRRLFTVFSGKHGARVVYILAEGFGLCGVEGDDHGQELVID